MLLSVVLLAGVAVALVWDSVPTTPLGWAKVRDAVAADPIVLRIALHQQRAEALEQAVLEMSTPGHANYGLHMSREQVRGYTAPSEKATEAVSGWLTGHGITPVIEHDWITITTTVSQANNLLNTSFDCIPDELLGHIDTVQPTTRFGQPARRKSPILNATFPDDEPGPFTFVSGTGANISCTPVTPECLKALYSISYTPSAKGNLVAFSSYLEQYARYTDLQTFEAGFVPSAIRHNFSVQLVNGGLDNQSSTRDAGEANLDVQYIVGISHPIPVLEYSTGGRGPLVPTQDQPNQPGGNEPYLEFLTWLLAQNDSVLPQTLSTSYGEEEQSVPRDYSLKVCNMFMQLGARGVSVLFSSGDSGPGDHCVSNVDNTPAFGPTFPAGCPFVTAVGATEGTAPEKGISFSSGGFSIHHARPSWQNTAIPAYLASIGDTYASLFNASGRGIPDVAAQGYNFAVVDGGMNTSASGTSASAPVFAGVVALLNAARKSQNRRPLGFLNPWLYQNQEALADITEGGSTGCFNLDTTASWNCTPGWDPVTGLGTPKFDRLLAAANL